MFWDASVVLTLLVGACYDSEISKHHLFSGIPIFWELDTSSNNEFGEQKKKLPRSMSDEKSHGLGVPRESYKDDLWVKEPRQSEKNSQKKVYLHR